MRRPLRSSLLLRSEFQDPPRPLLQQQNSNLSLETPRISVVSEATHLDFAEASHDASMRAVARFFQPTARAQEKKRFDIRCIILFHRIMDSKLFNVVSMLLVVYALVGSDVNTLCCDKPADTIFDVITTLSILFFCLEMVLSCYVTSGYICSFFFWLDLCSTGTLCLELQWVTDLLSSTFFGEDDVGNPGLYAARVVRVLRLVRILKIYKAFMRAKAAKDESAEHGCSCGLSNADADIEEAEALMQSQSKVGKKLSDRTTRRVIIVVLVMMLIIPAFRPNSSWLIGSSPAYGADVVFDAFANMVSVQEAGANASVLQVARDAYHQELLHYIYYHNWFTGRASKCPHGLSCSNLHYEHFFFASISVDRSQFADRAAAEAFAAQKAQLAQLPGGVVDSFDGSLTEATMKKLKYAYGSMPSNARGLIAGPWNTSCSSTSKLRLGFSLLENEQYTVSCPSSLRTAEQMWYVGRPLVRGSTKTKGWNMAFCFDGRPAAWAASKASLTNMALVCVLLLVASLFLEKQTRTMIVEPLEITMYKLRKIRENPLEAKTIADADLMQEFLQRENNNAPAHTNFLTHVWQYVTCTRPSRKVDECMETVLLEKTVVKLGSMLAVGLGEAGSSIISHNMKGLDTACVNAMLPGTRRECIIGVQRIGNFGVTAEVLNLQILAFVNHIAEIVHGVVHEFHGAPSKHNGDTFLLIWRVVEGESNAKIQVAAPPSPSSGGRMTKRSSLHPSVYDSNWKKRRLADMSIIAMMRVFVAVHSSRIVRQYAQHPGLVSRLGTKPVSISSGLHYGWAIEGAVGSEFKIDASYVSPNVTLAEGVEKATGIYGVGILVAGSVVKICSPGLARKTRLVDRVMITGSSTSMDLHALDLDSTHARTEKVLDIKWGSRKRFKAKQVLEITRNEHLMGGSSYMQNLFESDARLQMMRRTYTRPFRHIFAMGLENYIQGEWPMARRLLSRTLMMLGRPDGPSAALLKYMEGFNHEAPEQWRGVRDLRLALEFLE
eukprot:TRINITY_DN21079_c1_g2_i3.p1 TRINITY_DN21079_c1_g2~~TRINITY_DN21079_c1_g2_i3.p1  ORF type:complete len:1004 (-),score=173.93 TRINITY_DN21079_c1_g2_i3:121-3132(-)